MSLKIFAVGDIMLGERPLCNNFGIKSLIHKTGSDFLFKDASHLFDGGNIVFGNLECSIMNFNSNASEKTPFFCAEPDVINGLKNSHFNVISVANNHIMENGKDIYLHTIRILRNNGINAVGIRNKIEIINIKNYKIAFLAYSFIEDYIPDVCYNKIQSADTIIKDIKEVKPISDMIIISLHWGFEYIPYPSPNQIKIGRNLIDAGADIILGAHPHVTQSYEIYKNRPIFYSLGNFIFDHTYIPTTTDSFIAEINARDSLDSIDVDIIPVAIDKCDYHPQIMNSPQSNAFLKSVETIRGTFENRSISNYSESIGDYNLLYNQYKKNAKWNMKVHFVKNFYRYSRPTLIYILKNYIGKHHLFSWIEL